MRAIVYYTSIGMTYILMSLYNALVVELYTAIRSMLTWGYWMATGCTTEHIVEDQDGEIIHHFPQINFKE